MQWHGWLVRPCFFWVGPRLGNDDDAIAFNTYFETFLPQF